MPGSLQLEWAPEKTFSQMSNLYPQKKGTGSGAWELQELKAPEQT